MILSPWRQGLAERVRDTNGCMVIAMCVNRSESVTHSWTHQARGSRLIYLTFVNSVIVNILSLHLDYIFICVCVHVYACRCASTLVLCVRMAAELPE